jgi:hypothetical protein
MANNGCRVESSDDQALENEAAGGDADRRGQHPRPHWQSEMVDEIGDVGAEQHELAMGEVEDAHHAGDDAEAQHDEDDDGPEAQDFENGVERAFHAGDLPEAAGSEPHATPGEA